MLRALMLSAAYSWFVGLLVVMIVVTALFALILFIALKPVNKESLGMGDADYAKKLLGRREAELTSQLLKNQSNLEEMEKLMGKLREVSSAQKLINELVEEEQGPQDAAAKPAQKPFWSYLLPSKKPAKKQDNPARKAQTKPAQDKPAQAAAKPSEDKKPSENKK